MLVIPVQVWYFVYTSLCAAVDQYRSVTLHLLPVLFIYAAVHQCCWCASTVDPFALPMVLACTCDLPTVEPHLEHRFDTTLERPESALGLGCPVNQCKVHAMHGRMPCAVARHARPHAIQAHERHVRCRPCHPMPCMH